MKTVAISLALGDIYRDRGLGEINQPRDGAIERFNAVIKHEPSLVICTAGYSLASSVPCEKGLIGKMKM